MTLPESDYYEQDGTIQDEVPRRSKFSMISNDIRLKEKRKRILQLCLRKLERIKDSENNLRRSVCIHNTFARLTAELKLQKDKERGKKLQQTQQQSKKIPQPINQSMPKLSEKLDFDNLEELCSIEDDRMASWDPILRNCEEIEQALSRKRKSEVEEVLLSYHQLEKRLKTDIGSVADRIADAFREASEGQIDFNVDTPSNSSNFFQPSFCGKVAALDSSNGNFQSLGGRMET